MCFDAECVMREIDNTVEKLKNNFSDLENLMKELIKHDGDRFYLNESLAFSLKSTNERIIEKSDLTRVLSENKVDESVIAKINDELMNLGGDNFEVLIKRPYPIPNLSSPEYAQLLIYGCR